MSCKSTALAALCLMSILAACQQPAERPHARARVSALGVHQEGFPSWRERVVFVLTNRMRADPAAEIAETCPTTCSGDYPVVDPVVWSHEPNRAARFHATRACARPAPACSTPRSAPW